MFWYDCVDNVNATVESCHREILSSMKSNMLPSIVQCMQWIALDKKGGGILWDRVFPVERERSA